MGVAALTRIHQEAQMSTLGRLACLRSRMYVREDRRGQESEDPNIP